MANQLTGDFEAVVQIAVRQINGLLATLHQNGASDDAPLKLLHSATARLGDRRRRPGDDLVSDFGEWVREYQRARRPVTLGDIRAQLTATAPPGAARMIEGLFAKFGELPQLTPVPVRGTVRVQLGSPTLSLPSGSTSEVTVHFSIRALYDPDAGTEPMPAPVHGEVQATFEVRQVTSGSGRRLVVRPSAQDAKIQFIAAPGTGLSAADVARISTQVRRAVRESFTLLPVDLPPGFAFSAFKGLGSGPGQAIALPIQLSDAAPPPGGIQSVTNLFIGPGGFAIGVSREFVMTVFQPTIDGLLQFRRRVEIEILGPNPTYTITVTGVDLVFKNGSIDLTVKVHAHHRILPDYDIVVTQRLTLVMFLDTLFLAAPDDELTVATSGFLSGLLSGLRSRARSLFITERNRALPPAQDALNQQLRAARTRFDDALHSFDPAASAHFRAGSSADADAAASGAIAVTPDGVIIRGDVGGTARSAPVVAIAETNQRQAFTALESWIPGGRINRLIWSWVEYPGRFPVPWSGVEKSTTEEHRFVLPKPAGVTELSSICLRIEGIQTFANGRVLNVGGGTTCHAPTFGEIVDVPSWVEPVMVPLWSPDSTPETLVKEAIVGHVSVQADTPRANGLGHNSLVCFVDWQAAEPLAALSRSLAQLRSRKVSLVMIVVLPAGAFDGRRREIEARVSASLERSPVQWLLTEDHEGGWTRTFDVARIPSTYLINARREFVWKHEGPPDPALLAAALDQHLLPAPAPRTHPLRLAVVPGDRAPDAVFEDRGESGSLHRLRGREVLFTFWQPWSPPCIEELRRLGELQRQAGERAPFIVAFHGGRERRTLETIRQEHQLSFVLVHDADQVIARRYGVRCWPTTVSITADGHVGHVQFGLPHGRTARPERTETGSD